ncbi:YjcZ family sporulation protein [Paenibacillus sp. GCM10027628]
MDGYDSAYDFAPIGVILVLFILLIFILWLWIELGKSI